MQPPVQLPLPFRARLRLVCAPEQLSDHLALSPAETNLEAARRLHCNSVRFQCARPQTLPPPPASLLDSSLPASTAPVSHCVLSTTGRAPSSLTRAERREQLPKWQLQRHAWHQVGNFPSRSGAGRCEGAFLPGDADVVVLSNPLVSISASRESYDLRFQAESVGKEYPQKPCDGIPNGGQPLRACPFPRVCVSGNCPQSRDGKITLDETCTVHATCLKSRDAKLRLMQTSSGPRGCGGQRALDAGENR